MTTKILDNTVISASLKEIGSINLIAKCLERYEVVTSIEVYEETTDGFENSKIKECYKKIQVFDLSKHHLFVVLIEYLSDRYPYLHKGELTSFLVALIDYELKNKEYFFVTDDNKMKRVVSVIFDDELFLPKLSEKSINFKITGTIGLLKRLCERKVITKEDIEMIIEDLKTSTFYLTPELIYYLRGC